MKRHVLGLLAGTVLALGAAVSIARSEEATAQRVIAHYGDVAQAMYGDALSAAIDLKAAVDAFLANPSEQTLDKARAAWKAARPYYQQTEGYRFGNAIVDDWEGRVNSWPLDEGLIDYVDTVSYGETSDENPLYTANIIANTSIRVGNKMIDASTINADLLRNLQEAGDVEANVATGYHAVEFLLWGQDLQGTGPGAGERPYTDYDTKNCTHDHCDRRGQYLMAATDLLISDLQEMVDNWKPNGRARKELAAKGDEGGLATILTGIGSLSYGELAGERMKLGLILHDPEQEHDCFSDNTHNSHFADQEGMLAIYRGTYKRRDGSDLTGPSIADYAKAKASTEAAKLDALMTDTEAKLKAIKDKADSGAMAYDQMIGQGNDEGNALVQGGIDALVAQTHGVEALVAALGLKIKVEGSDSLDDPSKVK
jgi:putative iron-regulated protein